MRLWDAVLDLLFPPKCPFCGKVLERAGVCDVCDRELPWLDDGDQLRDGPDGLHCAGALWYQDLARDGLLRFKFQGASGAGNALGELVARCAAEHFGGAFDTVTWVPVSRKRLRKRGYDQAELLARAACRLWNVKPERLLEKTIHTQAQSTIRDEAARRANVLGVYQPKKGAEIDGKRILLIDDICTTGSTLTECVRVLKDAGAAEVMCAVVALTPRENVHNSAGE